MSGPGLLRSTAVFSAMTFMSRVSGLVRDRSMQARLRRQRRRSDAFVVAFRIPNFMRRLFAEGSFSTAFVPVLSGVQGRSATRPRSRS